MVTLLPFSEFACASRLSQEQTLSLLFEPCQTLQSLIINKLQFSTYTTYPEFIEAVRKVLLALLGSTSSTETIPAIIAAHPRLGAKKVESVLSQAEQASLSHENKAEADMLNDLNNQYEGTFPGLRYVVFVNGRPRPVIFEDMKRRIARNNYDLECEEAFNVSIIDNFFFYSKTLFLTSF